MVTKLGKKSESPIFKQILELVPPSVLRKAINKYKADKSCSKYFNQTAFHMLGNAMDGNDAAPIGQRIKQGIDPPDMVEQQKGDGSPAVTPDLEFFQQIAEVVHRGFRHAGRSGGK